MAELNLDKIDRAMMRGYERGHDGYRPGETAEVRSIQRRKKCPVCLHRGDYHPVIGFQICPDTCHPRLSAI